MSLSMMVEPPLIFPDNMCTFIWGTQIQDFRGIFFSSSLSARNFNQESQNSPQRLVCFTCHLINYLVINTFSKSKSEAGEKLWE